MMEKLVPLLLVAAVVFAVAGIALALSGQTAVGLALLAVAIMDAVVAMIFRYRFGL